ncbi:C-4 sterol methyl oxidase [Cystobasidiomycetes sp. EMM_F5]
MASQIVQSLGSVVNTTVSAAAGVLEGATLSSALKATQAPHHLYAGHDWSSLNLLEQWWARWVSGRTCTLMGNFLEMSKWIDDPVLATGIMSFILHEVTYFGRCIPWIIVDRVPYFRKYKLQDEKIPTPAEQWKCTKYVLMTHFTVELPQIWGFGPICEYFGMLTHHVPFPSWKAMTAQILLFFVFEDAFHYWAHRALHWGPLYKHIHKLHHSFSAFVAFPFGLATEYAHPLEVLILGTGTVGGPMLYTYLSGGNFHIITMEAFTGCYSTSFRWWDHMFGTDKGYKAKRERQRNARAAKAAAAAGGATKKTQ